MNIIQHKKYLSGLIFADVVSLGAFFMVLSKLNPFESTLLALSLFFLSFFFALLCTFTLLGILVRTHVNKHEVHNKHISTSLRQGVLLAACIDICAVLLMFGLLAWWSGLLLVVLVTLIEFYFTKED
jgi:hypothetical protein